MRAVAPYTNCKIKLNQLEYGRALAAITMQAAAPQTNCQRRAQSAAMRRRGRCGGTAAATTMRAAASQSNCERRAQSAQMRTNTIGSTVHELQLQAPINSNSVARLQQYCRTRFANRSPSQLKCNRASTAIRMQATAPHKMKGPMHSIERPAIQRFT